MSPPRCGSTAFPRVFWEQDSVGYYSHEPFETTYFWNEGLDKVYEKLEHPLDVRCLKKHKGGASGNALVIKEMPYQVGENFPLLVKLASKPMVILIRDPRLNISSRMQKKKEAGQNPIFPLVETGWDLLVSQLQYIQDRKIPYMIIDATDFRNSPEIIFPQVFSRLGLPFSPTMLEWEPTREVDIDNLAGIHRHLYRRALLSSGIQPATEVIPDFNSFPVEGGFREHIHHAMKIYENIGSDPMRIRL